MNTGRRTRPACFYLLSLLSRDNVVQIRMTSSTCASTSDWPTQTGYAESRCGRRLTQLGPRSIFFIQSTLSSRTVASVLLSRSNFKLPCVHAAIRLTPPSQVNLRLSEELQVNSIELTRWIDSLLAFIAARRLHCNCFISLNGMSQECGLRGLPDNL